MQLWTRFGPRHVSHSKHSKPGKLPFVSLFLEGTGTHTFVEYNQSQVSHVNVRMVKSIQENLGCSDDNSSLLQKGTPDVLPPSGQMAVASQHFHGHGGNLQLQYYMLLSTQRNSWRNKPDNLRDDL